MPRIRPALALAGTCLAAMPAAAAAAPSSPPPPTASPRCDVPALSQPLTAFGDQRNYVLAPGGSFETDPGWTLAGGAKVVEGNEPWRVVGANDARSLQLPAGASATSPAFCADPDWPIFRLFAREPGKIGSELRVEVLPAESPRGGPLLGGALLSRGATGWNLSHDLELTRTNGAAQQDARQVVVRVSSVARGGTWTIDDVLVDPRLRR